MINSSTKSPLLSCIKYIQEFKEPILNFFAINIIQSKGFLLCLAVYDCGSSLTVETAQQDQLSCFFQLLSFLLLINIHINLMSKLRFSLLRYHLRG